MIVSGLTVRPKVLRSRKAVRPKIILRNKVDGHN
jgi:hypothetical protein